VEVEAPLADADSPPRRQAMGETNSQPTRLFPVVGESGTCHGIGGLSDETENCLALPVAAVVFCRGTTCQFASTNSRVTRLLTFSGAL
jgi:hypothetical protein